MALVQRDLTAQDIVNLSHMVMHQSRMLQMLAEHPGKANTDEYDATLATNRAKWAGLDAAERNTVLAAIAPQKGASADYLTAAIAALET